MYENLARHGMTPGEFLGWLGKQERKFDAVVRMPRIDVNLPLRVIYQGLEFYPRPTLAYPPR